MRDTKAKLECVTIDSSAAHRGKQGLDYFSGISRESAGSTGICMHLINIPPGGRSRPHLHEHHESALYVLSGEAGMWFGEGLKQHLRVHAGQFLYVPADMPHLAYNASDTEPVTAVLARTDPNEQESVKAYDAPDPGIPA